ncbi:MAG: right-handed parallel beta-helix repeat-containing protein [Thermodesulfobacteriota bacterium]
MGFPGLLLALLALLALPGAALARVLAEDALWQGTVELPEDLLVPAGRTLTIAAGTQVLVEPADSTRIDPEYLAHGTEIAVRGRLRILGTADQPVRFLLASAGDRERWAGLVVDGGSLEAAGAVIRDAEAGVQVQAGSASLAGVVVEACRYGVVGLGPRAELTLSHSAIRDNDYGLLLLAGAQAREEELTLAGNRRRDRLFRPAVPVPVEPPAPQPAGLAERPLARVYGDEALVGETLWQGRILVQGTVRVPADSRLVILPGTLVEVARRDTNGDGYGENGLSIQGLLVAKGTPHAPIVFRSAEPHRQQGDWDAINILGSDQGDNLVEFCRIEDAFRGLHFHFSTVTVRGSRLANCLRGMQFQESLVTVRDSLFLGNTSALQARDSEVLLAGNHFLDNGQGVNVFRLGLTAAGNLFAGNLGDGLRIREGVSRLFGNTLAGNRSGLVMADARYAVLQGNLLAANHEAGLTLRSCDHLEVSGNAMLGNGLAGINLADVRAEIRGNLVTDNGERGLAIQSFAGRISGNNLAANGLYAIGIEASSDIDATGNWWGGLDPATVIYDGADEAGLGRVLVEPPAPAALPFTWPVARVPCDSTWRGAVRLEQRVTVPAGVTLTLAAGTTVTYPRPATLAVHGLLAARGGPAARIRFQAGGEAGPDDWDMLYFEHGNGSVLSEVDFVAGSWAIHSHLTDLAVTGCRFLDNRGGIRFHGGPLAVRGSLFAGNGIGLRAFRGLASVEGSAFVANEIGVFVREKGKRLALHDNNFLDNRRYAFRMGDFAEDDVAAGHNYWGAAGPGASIFDGASEPGIGRVLYEPVRLEPVAMTLARTP